MEEEGVTQQGGSNTTLSVEEPAATAPSSPGPPMSDVFDPVPLDDVVLALPAFGGTMAEEGVTPQGGSKTTSSVEEPAAAAAPSPGPPMGHVFDPVPFDGVVRILALPAAFGGALEDDWFLLGDEEEERADVYDDEDVEGDDIDEDGSGSDSDNEGNDEPVFWNGETDGSNGNLVSRDLTFLGQPARFASYQGTAGFMRLAAAEAPPGKDAGGEIVVHYRYYRFLPQSGGHGLEATDYGTDLHHVRYLVPFPAVVADPVSSLRLVGASVAAEVYPYGSYTQLQALWSGMLAAAPVRVPPGATGLVVTVDVGVLRSKDRTPECMECMRSALAEKARESDASPMGCGGQEQHLPAPVCGDGGEPGEVVVPRPAKRRRLDDVAAGEVCAICQDVLEQGLAAWPRCSHVFHGKCLEQLLATVRHRCPMCRSTLSVKGMFD